MPSLLTSNLYAESAFAASSSDFADAGASAHSRCLAANDSPMYDAWSSTPDATTTDAAHDGSSPRAHTLYALDALLKKTSVPTCEKPAAADGMCGTGSRACVTRWTGKATESSKCDANALLPTRGAPKVTSSATGTPASASSSAASVARAPDAPWPTIVTGTPAADAAAVRLERIAASSAASDLGTEHSAHAASATARSGSKPLAPTEAGTGASTALSSASLASAVVRSGSKPLAPTEAGTGASTAFSSARRRTVVDMYE